MRCALCQKDKILRFSHIVPEFLYGELYDNKHRFQEVSLDLNIQPAIHQKGVRETLLCEDCEQRFSVYEKYAKENFFDVAIESVKKTKNSVTFDSLDYSKLQLFFLSLIWRFSVTSLKSLQKADLGPHSEIIRLMLLSNDPGDWLKYPCLVTGIVHRDKHLSDLTAGAFANRIKGHIVWLIVVSGFVLIFFVAKHRNYPEIYKEAFLKQNGSFIVTNHNLSDLPMLYDFAHKLELAHKARKTNV